MQLFLYEHITASGVGAECLMREGDAMVRALAADFATLPRMNVLVARHPSLAPLNLGPRVTYIDPKTESALAMEDFAKAFLELRLRPDFALAIAPETDQTLVNVAMPLEVIAKTCLHPFAGSMALASDKHFFAERLALVEAPTPPVWRPTPAAPSLPEDWIFPSVIKPIDGAGSMGVRKVDSREEFEKTPLGENELIQQWVPGTPVSVAALCNASVFETLEPCQQKLGGESGFEYLGGMTPLPKHLAYRAKRLVEMAVICLQFQTKAPRGYVGVDMVLGNAPDGSQDYIIEVNPRMTTSYVGLRRYYKGNLAGALIDVVQGRAPKLTPRGAKGGIEVEWDAAGNVTVTEKK
jgi:predicted ATP-grasp superfamily ATP-dependent carboligase